MLWNLYLPPDNSTELGMRVPPQDMGCVSQLHVLIGIMEYSCSGTGKVGDSSVFVFSASPFQK